MGDVTPAGNFGGVYEGRRVLVTGHTGFKGSWLCTWLLQLGAVVAGYANGVPTEPSNFDVQGLSQRVRHYVGDVRDRDRLASAFDEFHPDCVFHLAAQALVRRSYEDPALTFEVNTLGTMNVLECLRQRPWIRSAVIITSDKCYRNVGWPWGYRETDVLGGEDPYSASKGCAELVAYAYYHSFLKNAEGTRIATARAGNVIGGGDWAPDRIVPDCVRSWSRGEEALIRAPSATRPWQHVLEPLSGYLWLGSELLRTSATVTGEAYNFGPHPTTIASVEDLVRALSRYWPKAPWTVVEAAMAGRPEATYLKLSTDKALAHLGWTATLTFEETVAWTGEWYGRYYACGGGIRELSREQIREYCRLAQVRKAIWMT